MDKKAGKDIRMRKKKGKIAREKIRRKRNRMRVS